MFFLLLLFGFACSRPEAPCVVNSASGFSKCLSSTSILVQGPFTIPSDSVVDLQELKEGTTVTVTGVVNWAKGTLSKDHWLFTLGGKNIMFDGTSGTFNGNGQLYWDGKGGNGGVPKPKMFKVKTTGKSTVKGITLKNTPVQAFSIGGDGTTIESVTIDNSAGDKNNLGHNTDGFDVSATNIIIQNVTVHNQDDCLAINEGNNIQFLNNRCYGGHGISIGSIGTGKVVTGVTVSDCLIANSQNGVRIKTIAHATNGHVSNVKYTNIHLVNIKDDGIIIEQDYENGKPTGKPTAGIPISDVVLTNIHGNMTSDAKHSVYILCAACSDFPFSGIAITGPKSSCKGISPLPQGC